MAKQKTIKKRSRRATPHDRALFVRISQELAEGIELLRRQRSEQDRGTLVTTSDVVRSILWDAIEGGAS